MKRGDHEPMIFFDAWKSWKQPPQFVWACKMRRKVVYSQREKLSKTSGKNLEFSVEITKTALTYAEEYVCFIRDDRQDPTVAEQWWNGLIDQILSLEALPKKVSDHSRTLLRRRLPQVLPHRLAVDVQRLGNLRNAPAVIPSKEIAWKAQARVGSQQTPAPYS